MISSLSGTATKLKPPKLTVNVHDVGYLVHVPHPVWEHLSDNESITLLIHTHIRENALDLYGFLQEEDRTLFSGLIAISGIGPKIALEICSIPKRDLKSAVSFSDAKVLQGIKGIGGKKAEKLLPDLRSIYEKHPELLVQGPDGESGGTIDEDALSALVTLGYKRAYVLSALRKIPKDIEKTEDKVAAVLRSL